MRRPFIFFIEGAITIVVGILAIFFLPHSPGHSQFLTPEERYVATHRMKLDAHGATTDSDVDREKFSWHWIRLALLNWNTILLSINFFTITTPIYSFSLFLPTIISALGHTRVNANLLTVPPNMAGFFAVLLVTYLSDRYKRRGIFMLIGTTLSIVGYIMLISTGRPLIQYGGTFFIGAGIFPCSPIVLGWLANNTAPHYVRATASGFQIGIANCAAFIATFTYIATDAPRFVFRCSRLEGGKADLACRYITGHAINIGVLILTLIVTSTTILYCKLENGKRERGERDDRLHGDQSFLGHRHPHFRYTI